jgi:hypothetical protein
MKLFENLSEENFLLYAAKNYYNPSCIDADEFFQDLKRFKYVKRLITKYQDTNQLSTNLILNHLVVIFNVFGIESGLRMLEFKLITDDNLHIIKPFLIYLKIITNDKYIGTSMDKKVVDELRKV